MHRLTHYLQANTLFNRLCMCHTAWVTTKVSSYSSRHDLNYDEVRVQFFWILRQYSLSNPFSSSPSSWNYPLFHQLGHTLKLQCSVIFKVIMIGTIAKKHIFWLAFGNDIVSGWWFPDSLGSGSRQGHLTNWYSHVPSLHVIFGILYAVLEARGLRRYCGRVVFLKMFVNIEKKIFSLWLYTSFFLNDDFEDENAWWCVGLSSWKVTEVWY